MEEGMDCQRHLDLGTIARSIIDSNFYMTLGTADENGRPWVSPV
jgi:Pyridoxamine 5'-phosphate oxidase